MDRLEEITARQAEIRDELAALEAAADPEGDDATRAQVLADRTAAVDALLAEWDALETERAPLQARAERLARVRAATTTPGIRERVGTGPEVMTRVTPYDNLEGVRAGIVPAGDLRSRALKAIETAPAHLDDAGREHVTGLVDAGGRQAPLIARHLLLTGSPEYHHEFEEFMQSAGRFVGPSLRAAMALSPDTAGGALVPFTLDPTIILTNLGIVDPMRQIATTRQIATDSWNGVTSAGVTAEWLAENTAAADASPTFAPKAIPVHKAFAWVVGSYEVLQDSNFASQLGRLIADAKARLDGQAFAVGDGSGKPTGVITAAVAVTTSRVGTTTNSTYSAADIYNVAAALRPRDAAQASWLANKATYLRIRQFDTGGGSSFWADLGMGTPGLLLGQPRYEVSSMDTLVGTTSTILAAGNMSAYYIIDRIGMTMQYNPMVMSATTGTPMGQAGWAAYWRVGGDLTDPDAVRVFRAASTTSGWA